MQKNDKDWGKIIIRIALLLFIIFFISRWFALRDESGNLSTISEQSAVQIVEEGEPSAPTEDLTEADSSEIETVQDTSGAGYSEDFSDNISESASDEVKSDTETQQDSFDTGHETDTAGAGTEDEKPSSYIEYRFRNRNLLDKHYDKHGIEMGFASAAEYEEAACAVANNPKALHKLEQEDGDDVYYIEDTGEFVVVSTDGFIRTYYYADKAYFDRQ